MIVYYKHIFNINNMIIIYNININYTAIALCNNKIYCITNNNSTLSIEPISTSE